MKSSVLSIFSDFIGWGYFVAWSISFYPQAILNWKRKSVQGLSIDFLCYNVLGFVCYSAFNLSFYFSADVQREYRKRNSSNDNLVRANDVVFAVHALMISLYTFSQTLRYKKDSSQCLSKFAKYFISASVLGMLCTLLLVLYSERFMVIDLMYYLSYVKLAVGLIKYIPQAWINFKRQSTVGWSIHNIFLDFTGGTLSIIQLVLDAYLSKDWDGILGVSRNNSKKKK
ncbi:PQ loop repeat-domain-containing protein [Sporodiniella umbellata]|nr:PQ loop repeat-domain-containing protein [Sporodiniella umbellata]